MFSSKEKKSQKLRTYDYRLNNSKKKKKKKKQSSEQCQLDENVKNIKVDIVYKIKENRALIRKTRNMINY